ncbi:hydroxysteroid 17-beta dehydrogenase 11 [Aspergillus lucknowensis]|uniref:Hydroxysteroid 17-beta dehydrogenase 11 n=1 Tax=Aspergillus lucknowensis TaxID=176173 RepID=A0ABR4M3U6_9EURO
MSYTEYRAVLCQWSDALSSRIRPHALEFLWQFPLSQKAVVALVALILFRRVNRALTNYSLNNWSRSREWDNKNELVLITGGCSGIGKQIAVGLARKGVRVVVLDIQEPVFTLGENIAFYRADVTSSESIRAVAKKIRTTHGDPTVLLNNAGVGNEGTILGKSEARIRQTFEINTISHFLLVQEFLPAMVTQNHGHIVTIASMASFVSLGEMVDYSCSKASALAFHEGLSQELSMWYNAPSVRTSIIHPSWVRTPMINTLTSAGDKFTQPILTPVEVADAIILPSYQLPMSFLRALPLWIQRGVGGLAARSLKTVTDWHRGAAEGAN